MGFIREPEGVDFVIDSGVLSDADRAEISACIREYRLKTEDKKNKIRKNQLQRRDGQQAGRRQSGKMEQKK
jgi:hypothetical protein